MEDACLKGSTYGGHESSGGIVYRALIYMYIGLLYICTRKGSTYGGHESSGGIASVHSHDTLKCMSVHKVEELRKGSTYTGECVR